MIPQLITLRKQFTTTLCLLMLIPTRSNSQGSKYKERIIHDSHNNTFQFCFILLIFPALWITPCWYQHGVIHKAGNIRSGKFTIATTTNWMSQNNRLHFFTGNQNCFKDNYWCHQHIPNNFWKNTTTITG